MSTESEAFVAAPAGGRVLVGRDAEIRALRAALRGLRAGAGRAIAVAGEPGIGKSALLAELTAQARALGMPVLAGHGREPDPLYLPGTPPRDGQDPRDAHEPAGPAAPAGTAMVVTIDDLHHLTADRIPAVQRLIRAVATGPLLLLVAYRERQLSPALAALLSRAASAGLLETMRLDALSPDQARALVGDLPDLDGVHRASLGNPQYLNAVAAHGAARAAAREAILGELAGLDPAALTLVHAAAVLDEPFPADLLAEVAGLDPADAGRALGVLTHLDLVRPAGPAARLALRHRALAEIVYQWLEPGLRVAMHLRAEAALAERAAPVARRAHHVARAADPSRPEHVSILLAAARDALYAAPAAASAHLEAAVSLLQPGDADWHEAQVLLARARLLAGDVHESRVLLHALRPGIPGRSAVHLSAVADAGRIEHRFGRYTEAVAIARSGLASLPDHDNPAAAALHTGLADAALDQQDYEAARHHAGLAALIAGRHQDRVEEANALALASLARLYTADQAGAEAAAARAADLVDAASDTVVVTNLQSLYQVGFAEATLGNLLDAQRHLTRGAALSRRTGQTYILSATLKALADVQLRSGSLRHALATLEETARLATHVSPATRAISMALRANALFWQGDPGDLAEVLVLAEHAAELAEGPPSAWAVVIRCLHAEIVLLTGDRARSGWLLLDAVGGTAMSRLTAWRRPRWCDTLAQVAQLEGDRESADHWARLAEDSVERLPSAGRSGFASRARMRAHLLTGDVDQAEHCARLAIEAFAGCGESIEAGRTLVAAAALKLTAGRTEDVGRWLDRAAFLAGRCGSRRLADDVAAERGRLAAYDGGERPGDRLAALSVREREIADLAGRGLTSREIAGALFLSVRTIDSHLGRIYRKLGVSGRAELARTLLNPRPRRIQ